jgi:hypothetical protein
MSIEFTVLEKPSNIIALPGNFIRPAFEKLYGFDAPQITPSVVDGALLTEPAGDILVTELDEPIAFEPA